MRDTFGTTDEVIVKYNGKEVGKVYPLIATESMVQQYKRSNRRDD